MNPPSVFYASFIKSGEPTGLERLLPFINAVMNKE